jgi:hypothetical protein
MGGRRVAGKEGVVQERGNRRRTEEAFRGWQDGTAHIIDL